MPVIIDIGCGKNKTADAVGIDISRESDADIICDLDAGYIPIKSGTADVIICQDVLEHIADTEKIFSEIVRISGQNAVVKIRTPHYTSRYAYNDHSHRHVWGFGFLLKIKEKFEKYDIRIDIKKRKLVFPKLWRITGIEMLMNILPHRYEQLFCFLFPAENMYFEIEVIKNSKRLVFD